MPMRCAVIGSRQPIIFAMMMVKNMLMTTVRQTLNCPGLKSMRRTRFTAASTVAQVRPTRNSFQRTFRTSDSSMSPTAMPRMIMVLAWLPQFPPVSMSIGIKVTRIGMTSKAAS